MRGTGSGKQKKHTGEASKDGPLAIPNGYAGLIWDKSGVALKTGLMSVGGVIDAGFRGELRILLANHSGSPVTISKGTPVAQMLVQQVVFPEVCETDDLDVTLRGENSFGSAESS
ncbi:MAG: hypothetical protein WDN67_05550 [Candidatus Moraniibacteriota bacterium]